MKLTHYLRFKNLLIDIINQGNIYCLNKDLQVQAK